LGINLLIGLLNTFSKQCYFSINRSRTVEAALGPVGHCTSHFKRAVCISCRPCVDVHRGEGGPAHVDACGQGEGGGQKRDFFVDVINGWPLM